MSHIFDSKLHLSEFYVYENYVVYLHVYHVRSCSPTPTYKQPLYGCQPDEPQASLATTNRCNHVYVVLFFILLFMYAVINCLYSVGNKITTTTIEEIVKYWGNWESPRKIIKYRSNSWWRHQMETFPVLPAFYAGWIPRNSPHKCQWRGTLVFSLI